MVNKLLYSLNKLIFLIIPLVGVFLFLPSALAKDAGVEFTAVVNTNKIATNEVVTLNIKLTNSATEDNIDFRGLKENFDITSTSNLTNLEIINGHSSSVREWVLVLKPKKDGNLEIPALKLTTQEGGELLTSPIMIEVSKAVISNSARNGAIVVSSNISKSSPYLDEPVVYQIQLYSVADQHIEFSLDSLKLDNAMAKPLGAYKVSDGRRGGKPVKIVEMNYLITPSKAGKIKIPKQIVSGVVNYTQGKRASFSSLLGLDWGDEQGTNTTSHRQHFQVATNETIIDVQPAVKDHMPWLPAKSLEIATEFDSKTTKVGVPIKLSVVIKSKGLEKNQLPHIGVDALKGERYKIYAENVETLDQQDKLPIASVRKEIYTIIPQEVGAITIPKISVKWWNTDKKQAQVAIAQPHKLDVLPNTADSISDKASPVNNSATLDNGNFEQIQPMNKLLWFLAGIIATIMVAWLVNLLRKSSFESKIGGDIKLITSASELYKFLQNYANQHYKVPLNSSLVSIFTAIADHKGVPKEQCQQIIVQLEGALYANKTIDIEELKNECRVLLKRSKKLNIITKKKRGLPGLNPTL